MFLRGFIERAKFFPLENYHKKIFFNVSLFTKLMKKLFNLKRISIQLLRTEEKHNTEYWFFHKSLGLVFKKFMRTHYHFSEEKKQQKESLLNAIFLCNTKWFSFFFCSRLLLNILWILFRSFFILLIDRLKSTFVCDLFWTDLIEIVLWTEF